MVDFDARGHLDGLFTGGHNIMDYGLILLLEETV